MAMVASAKPSLEYKQIDIPEPGQGQVTVQIEYVAQNPTDGEQQQSNASEISSVTLTHSIVQSFDAAAFGDNSVYGCDFVGKVTALGPKTSLLKEGDRVAGLIWGGQSCSMFLA